MKAVSTLLGLLAVITTGAAFNSSLQLGPGALAVHRRSLAGGARGQGYWSVYKNKFLDANANVVSFSGVTWSGFETPTAVVHGLWGRSLSSHLDQIKQLGFNAIRLPFAGETLLNGQRPQGGSTSGSPDLNGLTSVEVMDRVIAGCRQRGLKVILDYHRIRLTVANEAGLWYDSQYPESVWINNWAALARRYKGDDTVIGADVFNEVHPCAGCPTNAPYWVKNAGANEKYNFRSAVRRLIAAVHPIEPNWIFFIEGMWNSYWWGGNCWEVAKTPILFPYKKIAYSAHEYGPYVYVQPTFKAPDFPNNLPGLFRRRWGRIHENRIRPIWVGEFGSFYPTSQSWLDVTERKAFTTLIAYMQKLGVSWTIAFWGPDSKDTGGILRDDWNTPDQTKLTLLQCIMHPGFGPSSGPCRIPF